MAAVPVALTGSDQALCAVETRIFGWTVRNTHATEAGSVAIYDNATTNSGTLLGVISIPALTSSTVWFGPQGVLANKGIYVDIPATGTWSGSIYRG